MFLSLQVLLAFNSDLPHGHRRDMDTYSVSSDGSEEAEPLGVGQLTQTHRCHSGAGLEPRPLVLLVSFENTSPWLYTVTLLLALRREEKQPCSCCQMGKPRHRVVVAPGGVGGRPGKG
jgi:hypothetical protein